MHRQLFALIVLVGVLYPQDERPFEIDVVPRYVNEKRIVVNIQLTKQISGLFRRIYYRKKLRP